MYFFLICTLYKIQCYCHYNKILISRMQRSSKLQYNIECGNDKLCYNMNYVHFNTDVKFNTINTL